MAFDLFRKKQTPRDWSLTFVPRVPLVGPSRLEVSLAAARDVARDNKVSFRDRGAVVSRVIRF